MKSQQRQGENCLTAATRMVKYNQLLLIEEEVGPHATCPGAKMFVAQR